MPTASDYLNPNAFGPQGSFDLGDAPRALASGYSSGQQAGLAQRKLELEQDKLVRMQEQTMINMLNYKLQSMQSLGKDYEEVMSTMVSNPKKGKILLDQLEKKSTLLGYPMEPDFKMMIEKQALSPEEQAQFIKMAERAYSQPINPNDPQEAIDFYTTMNTVMGRKEFFDFMRSSGTARAQAGRSANTQARVDVREDKRVLEQRGRAINQDIKDFSAQAQPIDLALGVIAKAEETGELSNVDKEALVTAFSRGLTNEVLSNQEFGRRANLGSVLDKLRAKLGSYSDKQALTPDQLEDYKKVLMQRNGVSSQYFNYRFAPDLNYITSKTKELGLDPQNYIERSILDAYQKPSGGGDKVKSFLDRAASIVQKNKDAPKGILMKSLQDKARQVLKRPLTQKELKQVFGGGGKK